MERTTLFFNTNGDRLGSDECLLPITLYKGMRMTITGHQVPYEVVDWNYHHGHPDEDAGLRIILNPVNEI